MKYVLIQDGAPRVLEGDGSLDMLQSAVGGYIEAPLSYPSATRPNVALMIFCNEEGLLENLPGNVYSEQLQQVIVGPVVIIGNENGETVGLTDAEIEQVLIVRRSRDGFPVLQVAGTV